MTWDNSTSESMGVGYDEYDDGDDDEAVLGFQCIIKSAISEIINTLYFVKKMQFVIVMTWNMNISS